MLTGSPRFQVAVSRFIDDVSVLAIEDCLISKLSMLFRSKNVLEMSEQDRSRLAGETPESSLERKRLEAKRGILETGLQSLKSLHKRRNVVNPPQKDQASSEGSEQMSREWVMGSDRRLEEALPDLEVPHPGSTWSE